MSQLWDEGEVLAPRILDLAATTEWNPWHTSTEALQMFKDLCAQHPTLASYEVVGKNSNNEDMYLFKIGNPKGGIVLWDGRTHGNEDFGTEVLYQLATWLLTSNDAAAKRILNGNYVLMMPVINSLWNRGNWDKTNCSYGVNLNRNFKAGWTVIACNSTENYSGPAPLSEPESNVMRSVWGKWKPVFYLNLHQGAGPYIADYNGSPKVALAQQALALMKTIASQMNITPLPTSSLGSTGFACGDAGKDFGAASFLSEVDPSWSHTTTTWDKLVNQIAPALKTFLIAQCQLCETTTPPPPPPPPPTTSNAAVPIAILALAALMLLL